MSAEKPRAKLLRKGQELLAERGRLSDLTLRRLAELLGTSHRMLIHHFGGRDGYLAALTSELRKQEQAALSDLSTDGFYKDALQMLEGFYLDPAKEPRVSAFFYVLGLAVQDPESYREFLDSVEDWTVLFTTLGERDGASHEEAQARAQAIVWTARGLLVKAVTTGDRKQALDEFRSVIRVLGLSD